MLATLKLDDEAGRLSALQRYDILDTGEETGFTQILQLVQRVFDMPMAIVSLIDSDRQWFKARRGLDATETPRSVAFCHHTIAAAEGLAVEDAHLDPQFSDNPLVTGAPHVRSYLGAPLRTPDGYQVGALCVIGSDAREFSGEDREILQKFSDIVVSQMELRQIASRDALTGLLTRRAFTQALTDAIDSQRKTGVSRWALAIVDIDHFKQINDTFGHGVGDTVLVNVAQALETQLDVAATVGRLGGEEFGVLLEVTDAESAFKAAEALRLAVAAVCITDPQLSVTCSIGVAMLPHDPVEMADWMHAADMKLYAAKSGGRNRVVID